MPSPHTIGDVEFDLVTIGAGSSGVRASRLAAVEGANVAVIELPFGFISSEEKGGSGGTCVIRGCVPKKLLVIGSSFAPAFNQAKTFGWNFKDKPSFDWEFLMSNKAAEVKRLSELYKKQLDSAGAKLIEGRAFIKDAHTVEVTSVVDGSKQTLRTKHILIATGSYAIKAPIEGKEHACTSDHTLALAQLPQHRKVVIVGGGYIALEHASLFHGAGLEVHLFLRGEVPLTGFDREVSSHLAECMTQSGINFHYKTQTTKIEKKGEGDYLLYFKEGDKEGEMVGVGLVMFATGRNPRTKGLGLENAGVELGAKGEVKVDEFLRTNVPSVWATGDCIRKVPLTPMVIKEAHAFVATCIKGKPQKPCYDKEQAVEQLEDEVEVYVSKVKPMAASFDPHAQRAFTKVLVDSSTDQVVGMHMVGPEAPEIMQGFAAAMKCNMRKSQLDDTVGIHPSTAEEFVTIGACSRRLKGKGGTNSKH